MIIDVPVRPTVIALPGKRRHSSFRSLSDCPHLAVCAARELQVVAMKASFLQSSSDHSKTIAVIQEDQASVRTDALTELSMVARREALAFLEQLYGILQQRQEAQIEWSYQVETLWTVAIAQLLRDEDEAATHTMRQIHNFRLALGHVATTQVKLLELYTHIEYELTTADDANRAQRQEQEAEDPPKEDDDLVDVDLDCYREELKQLLMQDSTAQEKAIVPRSDASLLDELQEFVLENQETLNDDRRRERPAHYGFPYHNSSSSENQTHSSDNDVLEGPHEWPTCTDTNKTKPTHRLLPAVATTQD